MNAPHSRRHFLRSTGMMLSLPWMESLMPASERAASVKPPVRLGFLYVPNGVRVDNWYLAEEGTKFTLSPTLTPLETMRSEVLFTAGLTHNQGRDLGDGGGEHPLETSSWLTAAHPRKNFGR